MVYCVLGAVSSFSGLHVVASVSDITMHEISELFSYTFKTHDPLCAFPVTLSVWVTDSHLSNKGFYGISVEISPDAQVGNFALFLFSRCTFSANFWVDGSQIITEQLQ